MEQLQKEKEKLDDSGPSAKRKMLNDSSSKDFDEFAKETQKTVCNNTVMKFTAVYDT